MSVLWRRHSLADCLAPTRILLLNLVFFEQWPEHVLVAVVDGRATATSVHITILTALGFPLSVTILLANPRLLPLKVQLLLALLVDHLLSALVQAHAPLLGVDVVVDEAGNPLGMWPRNA